MALPVIKPQVIVMYEEQRASLMTSSDRKLIHMSAVGVCRMPADIVCQNVGLIRVYIYVEWGDYIQHYRKYPTANERAHL